MRAEELRALGDLGGLAGAGIAGQSRDLHAAVAARTFAALNMAGVPTTGTVRAVHDAIAETAYRGGGLIAGAAVRGGAALAARVGIVDGRELDARPAGVVARGVLQGAWGDRLVERGSVLHSPLSLLLEERRPATGRIVVFVHGLGETDRAWRRPGFAERLSRRGRDVVFARYNSGAGIEASAGELAAGLGALVAGWPVPVTELSLVGHSLGGLVIRAACRRGRGSRWASLVRVTVALGAPHEGAPLARVAGAAERALGALPETRPLAAPLRARSTAIRDLERGLATPFASGAEHYFVSASVTRDPDARVGRLLGDLLVTRHSAWAQPGPGARLRFDEDHYRHLGRVTHFDLLGHPAVGELLCAWIAPTPPRALAAA